MTLRARAAALIMAGGLALSAVAASADQTDSAVFDLTIRGITAGTLSVSGAISGDQYVVSGVLKSGGLLAFVRKVRYEARSEGTVADGRFTPARYAEDADTGKRQSKAVMAYIDGVPQVTTYDPPRDPRPTDVDPATQDGTIDPLTAIYATLRDVPEAEACNSQRLLFDGRRRSQVTLGAPEASGKGVVSCAGEYRRLAGFSEREMAEKVSFPFRLIYDPIGDGRLRVREIVMDTLYGKGRLKRR